LTIDSLAIEEPGSRSIRGVHAGEVYMDVGTLEGYRAAQDFLRRSEPALAG